MSVGCCPRGVLEVELPTTGVTTLAWTDLANPSYPGSTYAGVRLVGGGDGPELRLPAATDVTSYAIEVENRSDGSVLVSSDDHGASFSLDAFLDLEVSLEEEIQADADSLWTYRTDVRVDAGGARRVPGFTG